MSLVAFDSLPDESRLWCFGASRAPGGAETAHILDSVHAFVGDWTAHSRELTAAIRWRDQRFLLVGLDEARAGASGCSIDVLTRHVNQIESRLEIRLLDATPVWYRDAAGRVRSCSREEFRSLAAAGRVDEGTPVFDLTVDRMADYRAGRFEKPAADSWHRSLLTGI